MVRLNDINNFIEVSHFSSLSLAAKKLDVTQPALSESIKRLEKDLNTKLFYRTKNGISLTPEGKIRLEKSKQVRNLISDLVQPKLSDNYSNIILGCHVAIGAYFLPTFFDKANKIITGYKVQLNHDLSRNIQEQIQRGVIDIGVVVNPVQNPDLIIKPFEHDNVCVWTSKRPKVQKQIIADTNLFQVQSILKNWKNAPTKILHTDTLDLIGRLTEKGAGVGVIPEKTVKLLKLNLKKIPSAPSYKDTFCIVHRPEFGKNNYERTIIELIMQSF